MPPCSAITPSPLVFRRCGYKNDRFRRRPEPVEIIARGLGKLKEFAQQVFRARERDVQVARFQGHFR